MIGTNTTTVNGHLAAWEPLRPCEEASKWFWLILYTSSRRTIPALWVGSVLTFADVTKYSMHKTITAIDDLLTHELVEFDDKREVLRLTKLPDRSMRPHNGKHLRSVWTKFQGVVACDVRNAHVRTLSWLLDDPEHPITPDHGVVWEQTFGTVAVPPQRRRGAKRLLDEDTSTPSQPSLFRTKPTEIVSHPLQTDTHTHTHRDQRSEIRDLSSPISEESKGDANEAVDNLALPIVVSVPVMDDLPWSIEQMLSTIAQHARGRFQASPFDGRLTEALVATVRACERSGVTLADLELAGGWLGSGGLAYRSDLGAAWLARPGNLLDAIAAARAWSGSGKPDLNNRAASRGVPGRRVVPAPLGAHGTGKRRL